MTPYPELQQIVREETDNGRGIVRFLFLAMGRRVRQLHSRPPANGQQSPRHTRHRTGNPVRRGQPKASRSKRLRPAQDCGRCRGTAQRRRTRTRRLHEEVHQKRTQYDPFLPGCHEWPDKELQSLSPHSRSKGTTRTRLPSARPVPQTQGRRAKAPAPGSGLARIPARSVPAH